jgi:hypothetical protein
VSVIGHPLFLLGIVILLAALIGGNIEALGARIPSLKPYQAWLLGIAGAGLVIGVVVTNLRSGPRVTEATIEWTSAGPTPVDCSLAESKPYGLHSHTFEGRIEVSGNPQRVVFRVTVGAGPDRWVSSRQTREPGGPVISFDGAVNFEYVVGGEPQEPPLGPSGGTVPIQLEVKEPIQKKSVSSYLPYPAECKYLRPVSWSPWE